MSTKPAGDSYSAAERRILGPARTVLSAIYGPIARALTRIGVTPNAVSLSQILVGIVVVILIPTQPRVALVLFVIALALDGIDGALARASGRVTKFGGLLDQYADHVREVLVVGGLAAHGALHPLIATLYGVAYPGVNLTLYLCNTYRAPLPLAIKTYMTFYPALALYLWAGVNVLDWAGSLAVATMGILVAQGLWRLRATMD
ncbi:MAG: CDP-alcohol phosphatidyltransferase family protein [Candidatus Limnocylindria bacterium]